MLLEVPSILCLICHSTGTAERWGGSRKPDTASTSGVAKLLTSALWLSILNNTRIREFSLLEHQEVSREKQVQAMLRNRGVSMDCQTGTS